MRHDELRDIWMDDGLISIEKTLDDSWRHGNNVEEVFLDEHTSKYYLVSYQKSGDGEYHGIRDGEFEFWEVVPEVEEKIVSVTKWIRV